MKTLLLGIIALCVVSCKPSYSYEGQQRGGDPYRIEWITSNNRVATCFVVDDSAGRMTSSTDEGLETALNRFFPDGDTLHIYDAKGVLIESLPIHKHIFYCSSKGYSKMVRSSDISDLLSADYRDMSHKLVDHLRMKKYIP